MLAPGQPFTHQVQPQYTLKKVSISLGPGYELLESPWGYL